MNKLKHCVTLFLAIACSICGGIKDTSTTDRPNTPETTTETPPQ